MIIPEAYNHALEIAKSSGFVRSGFYFKDGIVSTPHIRTRYFAKYFFKTEDDFQAFLNSSDPQKFIEDYIKRFWT